MLAYASYMFTRDYGGNLYASTVFQALIQSAGGLKSWSIHNGSVADMDFFPGTNRMLTVSTYGEIIQHEMRNGHLTGFDGFHAISTLKKENFCLYLLLFGPYVFLFHYFFVILAHICRKRANEALDMK